MITLFSHDEIMEMHDNEIRRESLAEGRAEGRSGGRKEGRAEGAFKRDRLYNELVSRLIPLGRIDDILAATSDSSKLAALAEEFGLEI